MNNTKGLVLDNFHPTKVPPLILANQLVSVGSNARLAINIPHRWLHSLTGSTIKQEKAKTNHIIMANKLRETNFVTPHKHTQYQLLEIMAKNILDLETTLSRPTINLSQPQYNIKSVYIFTRILFL